MDIMLYSWQDTSLSYIVVSLSIPKYKWLPANCSQGGGGYSGILAMRDAKAFLGLEIFWRIFWGRKVFGRDFF